jgi:hypothetical protein
MNPINVVNSINIMNPIIILNLLNAMGLGTRDSVPGSHPRGYRGGTPLLFKHKNIPPS